MKKSRVFIGPLEVANVAKSLAVALRTQKIAADFVTYSNSHHPFGYETEKVLFFYKKSPIIGLNRILRYYYLMKIILRYNTFIFLSPETLLPKNKDLLLLKLLMKKIIFIFTGCAERDPSFDINNHSYICNNCRDESWQKMFLCKEISKKGKRVEKFERYASAIISTPDCSSFLINKRPIWRFLSCERPPEKDYLLKFDNKKIRIAHLPSNPLVKQTHIIMPILNQIAGEKRAEIIVKDGIWDNKRILHELENIHILVDSMGHPYGMLSIEAMSRGCIIMNGFDSWMKENVPDAPIYKISSETLYDDICFLLEHRDLMIDYAKRSMEFYNRNHSPEAIGKFYKENLELR